MKEYIAAVLKKVDLTKTTQKQVKRNLEEILAEGQKQGESEAEIIQRLGTPEFFADNLKENLPQRLLDQAQQKNKKLTSAIGILLGIVAIVIAFIFQPRSYPENAIGGADGPTDIYVESTVFTWWNILFVLGLLFLLFGLVYLWFNRRKK